MSIEVRVKVVFRRSKGTFVLRWRDIETGADRERSAKTTVRKEAERLAGELRADLREGRFAEPSKLLWEDFRLRLETEKLPGLAGRTQTSYKTALNRLEGLVHPQRVSELNAAAISTFQRRLRDEGIREATIAMYLRHIKAGLRWGHAMGYVTVVPKIQMPKRARRQRQMRGRPITREEFERMIMLCEKERPGDHRLWKGLLEGLWLSGLRLGEALKLSWDHHAEFAVDTAGKYPCFAICAEAEKGFEDRRLPMTPDFADWLLQTPVEEREGKVFGVAKLGLRLDSVSKAISAIGKTAGVVVNREQEKFASAHDLRRAFGTRWASKLKPAELQQIMRHVSISTTLGYYVLVDADSLAERLWRASDKNAATPGVE